MIEENRLAGRIDEQAARRRSVLELCLQTGMILQPDSTEHGAVVEIIGRQPALFQDATLLHEAIDLLDLPGRPRFGRQEGQETQVLRGDFGKRKLLPDRSRSTTSPALEFRP